jgi:hypothetical protein
VGRIGEFNVETVQIREMPKAPFRNCRFAGCGAMIGTAESGDDFMHGKIAPAARQFQ